MESLFNFIISTDSRYNNKIDLDGNELIVNTEITERDYHFVNRIGTVVNVPRLCYTHIKEGDKVIVHHNVFRRWYDQRGNEKNGKSFLTENTFACDPDQVFGYDNGDGWKATDGYCFVAPIESKDVWELSNELTTTGIMIYTPAELEHLKGHIVGFTPNSEYEFNIDGQKLYRVLSNQITIDYGREEKKKTDNRLEPQSA